MDTWKGIGVSTSHGGVIGSHIRCTKMHQNVSKRTKIDQNCGAFWCTSCVNPWPLHGLYWLLSPFKSPFYPEKDHISHSGQIRNTFALSWYSEHFGPFWSIWYIFVHFGAPHVWPRESSMACTDSYRLSSVNLIQNKSPKGIKRSAFPLPCHKLRC